MARIPLVGGYAQMKDGMNVLKIVAAEYDEDFGKVSVTLEDARGAKLYENYSLMRETGEINESANAVFTTFVRTAMCDDELTDIDPDELVGHYVRGVIGHRQYFSRDGKPKSVPAKAEGTWWESPTEAEIRKYEKAVKKSARSGRGKITLGDEG